MKQAGGIGFVYPLPEGSEQHDSQGKTQTAGCRIDKAQAQVITFLGIGQHHRQNSTVGGDQRQVHAQSIVQRADFLL